MAKQKFNFVNSNFPIKTNLEENLDVITRGTESASEEAEEKTETPIVGQLVNQLSKEKERSPYDIKFISRNLLKSNKRNNYPKEKLDNMKESILYYGLQEPLGVISIKEENEYIVEFGHTRMYAIDELIKEFKDWQDKDSEEYQYYLKNIDMFEKKGYPCMVKDVLAEGIKYYYDDETDLANVPEQVIDSEIRLIITNEIRRDESASTKAVNVARLAKLYERKNAGKKKRSEKININEQIASDLNITARQVANYKRIGKLIPGLQKAFEDNKISLKDSSSYAQLSEEDQEVILSLVESGKKVSKNEIDTLKKEKQQLEDELKSKEDTLISLQGQIKNLKEKEENLKAELESKESIPEPETIVVPDPKMPEIENQLKEKEDEVKKLKEEVKNLKQQTSNRKKMDAAQSEVVKKDLALRNAFEECKKAIGKFIENSEELMNSYEKISSDDLKNLAILNQADIEDRKNVLIKLFE